MLKQITKLLLELGSGFASVGNQYHVEVVGEDFYLSAVDDIFKTKQDNPTIGLLLCREKNKLIAEYAPKDMTKPMGLSEYKLF